MKKLLFIIAIAITGVTSAQTISGSATDLKKSSNSISKSASESVNTMDKKTQKQISEQLVINEDLSKQAMDYLKSNPDTKEKVSEMYKENDGSLKGTMKSIMNDPELSTKVIKWVNDNPKVLKQAMGLIGM